MDIIDQVSKNPDVDPVSFRRLYEAMFDELNMPRFETKEQAAAFVSAIDGIFRNLNEQGVTLPAERVLQFGAALGEAMGLIFAGDWTYNDNWERWGVRCKNQAGEPYDINVFNKLRKRYENGDEDSISYFLDGTKAAIEGSLNL